VSKIDSQIEAIKNDVKKQHTVIQSTLNTSNNEKYIDILPYTDIIYMYFILLLLIIYQCIYIYI
jgi:hypothetical protein